MLKGDAERIQAWDDVVRACPYASFFHTRAWAELFEKTLGTWKSDPVAVEFSDGNVAVLPLVRRVDSEHRESMVPGMYGGPLFLKTPTEEHLEGFQGHLWFKDIFVLDNPFAPFNWDPDGLIKWRMHTHLTDLSQGFDEVWGRFRTNVKRNIKKAEAANIEIRVGTSVDDIRQYFDVYEATLPRFGDNLRSFYPIAFFEHLAALPQFGTEIKVTLASVEGRVVSGLIMLNRGDNAVAWHYSTRPDDLDTHACPLLLRNAMQEAASNGIRWFDFLVSGPLKGVAHFKEGFGTIRKTCNMYWSPDVTPVTERPDTGLGAAIEKSRQLREQGTTPA